jgi:hypothetical protein
MKRFATLSLLICGLAGGLMAQTARVQVIHNSADPAAALVDVYVNGALALNDFKFRTATPFIDLPAETLVTIGIAPYTSTSADDAIANFEYTLAADEKYVVVANGVLDPGAFGANPDGTSTAFNLFVYAGAREAATSSTNVDFIFFHGATDAPTVDALARNVATVVDNASYTDFQGYVSVPAGKYLIDVTPGDDNSIIVATARAFLQGAGGASAVIFASGFLSTDDEPTGARSFKVMVALPDGTVKVLPLLNTAPVQIIHNAADPAASEVDIYLNGALALDNFAFRTATPYLELPANQDVSIAVAGAASTSVDDALATFTANFKAGSGYTVIANGVLDPSAFAANPDGASTAFNLWVREGALANSTTTSSDISFIGVHGSTDAPTVDVIARDVATLLDNVSYGAVSNYVTVPAGSYILDIALGDAPEVVVVSYSADLSTLGGGSAVVFASGFLDPSAGPEGSEAFGLYYTLADGTTGAFPVYTMLTEGEGAARFANTTANVFPNPASDVLNITFDAAFNGIITLVSTDGRTVANESFATDFAGAFQMNISDLPAGLYMLNMNNGSEINTIPVSIR